MTKRFFALFLILATITTTACAATYRAEQAGKALAEANCLTFTDPELLTLDEDSINAIYLKYGFSDATELDEYVASVEGTTEFNEVAVSVRTHLEETCGEELAELGIDAAEIYEPIVGQ
jgi:hypothetical protein